MTILCEPNKATAAAMVSHLDTTDGIRVVDNLIDAAAWVGYDADERLVLIGAAVPFIDVVAFADYMHTIYPDALLILLREDADDDIVIEAQAAGITEVVPAADAGALVAACDAARATLSSRIVPDGDEPGEDVVVEQPPATESAPLGEVVTVFSAKGGTGKTVVSTNLALALNAGGRRVCLLDLDLEFGDVAIAMQLAPTRGIADAVELDLRADDAISALITPYAPRLDCVLAPVNPGESDRISPALIAAVIAQLRTRYDYIVIDTPSQFSEHVLEAFDAADHHVLVTTPEIPSLKNLRLTIDMLDMLDYDRGRRCVVLNRSDPKVGLSVADAEAAIRTSITTQLAATQSVPASINKGAPLVSSEPDHPFAQAVRAFADAAITNTPVVSTERPRRLGLKLRQRSS